MVFVFDFDIGLFSLGNWTSLLQTLVWCDVL